MIARVESRRREFWLAATESIFYFVASKVATPAKQTINASSKSNGILYCLTVLNIRYSGILANVPYLRKL